MTKIYVITEEEHYDIETKFHRVVEARHDKKEADVLCAKLNSETGDDFTYYVEETEFYEL